MSSVKNYDIIVIGAGSAGLGVSGFMAMAGFKTLLIDKSEERIGGECLNDGCIPSKALLHVSRMFAVAQRTSGFGPEVSGKADIHKVMDYVRERQAIIREHENKDFLEKKGMDLVIGHASFKSSHEIKVNDQKFRGRKIVIATGSKPKTIELPGLEHVKSFTNEDIFQIEDLPGKLLVIGGGPNGVELGQAFQRFGSQVTIVQKGERLIPRDDPAMAQILRKSLEKEGVNILLNHEPVEVQEGGKIKFRSSSGKEHWGQFDAVYFAVGREVDVSPLQPENAGIQISNGTLKLNDHLQTSRKHIYAAGDVVDGLKFSHGAELHVRILINNFFSPVKKKLDYRNFSWVTFTDPEVAAFGMAETHLIDHGFKYERLEFDFSEDDRAVVSNYRYGKLVLFISENRFRKQRILGGSMIAPQAGEMIQELILAMNENIPIDSVFDKVYPYPVASRVNQQAIQPKMEGKLTPHVKRFLKLAYKPKSCIREFMSFSKASR